MYETKEQYREAWEKAYELDPPVPLNIDLELASICNLRCPFCFIPDPNFEKFIAQKAEDGQGLRRLMPKEMAFRLIDEAAAIGVPALKFNWRGESTLHRDYAEIVKYAAQKKKSIVEVSAPPGIVQSWSARERPAFKELLANTNANCPDAAIDGLMACTKVMVSMDSMDPAIYPTMRVGGSLDRAKEVVWELVRRGHPNVWVRRVMAKANEKEDFFDAVKKEWGDKVKTSEHFCFDRNATKANEISGCDHDDGMPRKFCGYPAQRIIITSAGYVYPCCLDLHETMRVGDVNTQSIMDIWNGDKLRELRKSLRSLDTSTWSKTCQNCESWMSWDAPQRAHVQDKENIPAKIAI
jgi:radical SAM protein with 4Fe4S-binding SPASM domain